MNASARFGIALAAATLCVGSWPGARAADPMAPGAEKVSGYLADADVPDSLALLPPPPALGSATEAMDQEIASRALALRGTPRFDLAALDADLTFPNAAGTFSCALGVSITAADTPTLYRMLRRVAIDAGRATRAAKDKYRHARPFTLDGAPTCQPAADDALRTNGSYPSGHTSIGWAWAEALAEIAPDRAQAVLERGRAFGESRIACNVHWATDVIEGRMMGSATVAKLNANEAFLADVKTARGELDAARTKGSTPQRDCALEGQALKQSGWLAP